MIILLEDVFSSYGSKLQLTNVLFSGRIEVITKNVGRFCEKFGRCCCILGGFRHLIRVFLMYLSRFEMSSGGEKRLGCFHCLGRTVAILFSYYKT